MAKPQTDEELNLRRKARRRLVGAVALTLAVVVILPMVLDNEPKPTGKDLDLRIPAPDKVGEFVPGVPVSEIPETLPLAASEVLAASTVEVASAPVAVSTVASSPAQKAITTQTNSTSKNQVTGKVQSASTPALDIPGSTNKKAEIKAPEVKPPSRPDPQAILEGKVKTLESEAGYVAQIGAFANAETAKQELARLKGWGFKAYTEKVGDKVRVRVGPYTERDKVEKVRKLLENHGLHPTIVPLK